MIGLIGRIVRHFNLDLTGAVVLTEAANNAFACTCLAAALAGAEVFAVARDTGYGKAVDIIDTIDAMARQLGVRTQMRFIEAVENMDLSRVDIATNLGPVRPLQAGIIQAMRPGATLALMCEAWEVRPADVDLSAAHNKGLAVFGTNEDHAEVDVFSYVGLVAVKMILSLGREIAGNTILVVGTDKFAARSAYILDRLGAVVIMADNVSWPSRLSPEIDVAVFADYTFAGTYIGIDGRLRPEDFARHCPQACVAVLCGRVDGHGLVAQGIPCLPDTMTTSLRMITFDYLGELPVVKLHTAGLKVAEYSWRTWDPDRTRDKNEKAVISASAGMADPVDWNNYA